MGGSSGLKTAPTQTWYEKMDDAAWAAAFEMRQRYDADSFMYEAGVEQFSWIYEYNNFLLNPDWEPGDPCLLYSFTGPVWGSAGAVTEETQNQEEAKVASECRVVGDVHSHGKDGGNGFSDRDRQSARLQAMLRESDFHRYLLGDMYNEDTGTQEQKFKVLDVSRRWDGDLRRYLYPTGIYVLTGYDPNKPSDPWVPSNPERLPSLSSPG